MTNGIHIGTSGWHYRHWKGPFYPLDLSRGDFLKFYAERLNTVEVNRSFFQLPEREVLKRWRDTVKSGFIFTIKASRYITHTKKLKDAVAPLHALLESVKPLGGKLGPILFQMPLRWRFDADRFYDFLEALPRDFRFAFELRHPSWHITEVYDAMTEMGVALCIGELNGKISPKVITSDFVYVRLHGPGGRSKGYSAKTLAGWAGAFSAWAGQGREIFCYFDNDESAHAARDAVRLKTMMEKE
jgi:uncharacterized protein YecE (DUF72 family)